MSEKQNKLNSQLLLFDCMTHKIQIVKAPSILGLKPSGVEGLPQSLLDKGLTNKINSTPETIEVSHLNHDYRRERDPESGCLNPASIHRFSVALMQTLREQLRKEIFPLVLGGDCSILLGIMPALKISGHYGLIFMDAHSDFYLPHQSTTGEVADMDLSIITGRGPEVLTNIQDLAPYIEDEKVIHVGQRDAEEVRHYGGQEISEAEITTFDMAKIRAAGVKKITAEIITIMNNLSLDGFWIHFDTDVISDDENPAVDYRLPGGLTFAEAGYMLNQLYRTGKIKGMDVTIFNPDLDKDGVIAERIVGCIAKSFDTKSVY